MILNTPLTSLGQVGKSAGLALKRLGVETLRELLYYFPWRYEDYRRLAPLGRWPVGELATARAQIQAISNRRSFHRRATVTEAIVKDNTGVARVVWFNQPYLARLLRPGDWVYLAGKMAVDALGPILKSPVFEKAGATAPLHAARLVPVYPLTLGLTQKQVRWLVGQALGKAAEVKEWLPESVRRRFKLITLGAALPGIHFPDNPEQLSQAIRRLKFDELCVLQLKGALQRLARAKLRAPALTFQAPPMKQWIDGLPFILTRAQKRAAWEILQDLGRTIPMHRLLSGEVGSGKTVVAAMALYSSVLNNYQGVLMAPTEVLARQHFASVTRLLARSGVTVGLYTRSQRLVFKGSEEQTVTRAAVLRALLSGELSVTVGTHALLSDAVKFRHLGLVVVDEQQRFGVEQRRLIKDKGAGAHFLSLTATPIPRSLALVLTGDLAVSAIDELPPGRQAVATRLVPPEARARAYQFIRAEVARGRQVFVVCPVIEASETQNAERGTLHGEPDNGQVMRYTLRVTELVEKRSVLSEYEKLSKQIFPDLRVGYLHGKLKSKEKEATMAKFTARELDILVSTAVVEVGVDIPNATVMMIEGAERFGLSQLHQFRGRVGRGAHRSYCLLFTTGEAGAKTSARLQWFAAHHNGFALAEKDLELRGPGEVYGTAQSGLPELKLATMADRELIAAARTVAEELAPRLARHPATLEKLRQAVPAVHWE